MGGNQKTMRLDETQGWMNHDGWMQYLAMPFLEAKLAVYGRPRRETGSTTDAEPDEAMKMFSEVTMEWDGI